MQTDIINIGLAFVEGLVLILSPCILPILPLILVGSLYSNKTRPLGIIVGFIVTFTLVTLFSKWLITLAHINGNTLRTFSYVILVLLGIIMMSDYLSDKVSHLTSRLNQSPAANQHGGFLSGLLFGGLIGIIWTPCVGPILAAVIVQTIVATTTFNSALIVIAFAIGVAIPMFIIALLGKKIISKFAFFRRQSSLIRKILGIILILSVFLMIYSPSLALLNPGSNSSYTSVQDESINPYPAPALIAKNWINSPPLTLKDLKGKVVLVDFWTYTCINCVRTLPHMKAWYAKYHDKGLVIIGVHSPEFPFEDDLDNVTKAVKRFGITYPVMLDNNFQTWENYHNQYWPSHYLINRDGNVVYQHFGEGDYAGTEAMIQKLLGVQGQTRSSTTDNSLETASQSPEMYFGFERANEFASPETAKINQPTVYSYPTVLPQNSWALKGKWIIFLNKIVAAEPGASIKLNFNAKNVYSVMGTTSKTAVVKVLLHEQTANNTKDVINGQIIVNASRLYTLLNLPQFSNGILELIATTPGLEMYTFTFGG